MPTPEPSVNCTLCHGRRVRFDRPVLPCDRCGQPARRAGAAAPTALDIALDGPVLLPVAVSVHHGPTCRHTFRAPPPFLRPDASYTNRVVTKAVFSVYQDGMAIRRVAGRLARDFWVQPSEGMIRQWCRAYAEGLDLAGDDQPWVVAAFSGILCVDEVYQDRLALPLAVDPAAPEGDRLVGYQLVHGPVDQQDVHAFLGTLNELGIAPEQVITDGSRPYPAVLAQVWPAAAHQRCLFHAARAATAAVQRVYRAVRATIPALPRASARAPAGGAERRQAAPTLRGRPRAPPPPDDATDAAALKWRWRQAAEATLRAEVHRLRRQGVALRAIARQTGLVRRTVRRPLQAAPAEGVGGAPAPATAATAAVQPAAPRTLAELPPPPGPPAPWASWAEVRPARAALTACRFLLRRRPEHLAAEEQARRGALLARPLGAPLRVARAVLLDWFALWRDDGRRRRLEDARGRWRQGREDPAYRAVAPLRRGQQPVDEARCTTLRQFLRQPDWEAPNNGAARRGRAFRHQQAPHFRLRTAPAIDGALKAGAILQQERVVGAPRLAAGRCSRGRKPRRQGELLLVAQSLATSTDAPVPGRDRPGG